MQNQNPTIILSLFKTTLLWIFLSSIMFFGVKSQDQSPSLLCISECGTCPKICSPSSPPEVSSTPPPAPEVSSTPPPSPSKRPPLPHSSPPVPPHSFLTPPGAIITPIKPQPPSSQSPPPPAPVHNYPPSFPYYSLTPPSPPPPSKPATPPPPPSNNVNIPAGVSPPAAGFGQKNFSNPYYYFYVSEGASKNTLCGPILAAMLMFFHVVYSAL